MLDNKGFDIWADGYDKCREIRCDLYAGLNGMKEISV
jgi:hypothetical protein